MAAEQPNPQRRRPTTLNDLPESLLIHILTLMPVLSAVETSFISRQWRNLWHLMPTLKLNPHDDDDPLYFNAYDYDANVADTITQVLANRPKSNPLREFHLNFEYRADYRHRAFATTWIRYALDCNVEEMSLCFDCPDHEPRYPFHFFDIKNKPVRCLKLWRCEIVMPHLGSIQFDSLRVLYLTCMSGTHDSLTDLISRCRNLEKLRLCTFDGLINLKIRSKSLKVLKLLYCLAAEDDSSIEIDTPNLSSIEVNNFYAVNFAGDLSSVKQVLLQFWNVHIYFEKCWGNTLHLNLFRGVECLKIKELFPRYVLSKFSYDGCFQLERLKHLEVQVGYTLDDILGVCVLLEQAPALQSLVFNDAGRSINEESLSDEFNHLAFKLHIPSLLEVKIIDFRNTMFEHGILLLLWKHGVVLNKVVLVPPSILGKPTAVLDPRSNVFVKFLVERRID